MNMKRQRGRNNGRNKPHMPNRGTQTFDSSGPEVRIRGNAYQVLEKYLAMARDAASAGDRIAAENYYQHAEHYYRVINANNEGRQHPQQGGQHPQQGGQHPHQGGQHPHQGQQHGQHQHPDQRGMAQDGSHGNDPGAGPQPLTGQANGGDGQSH